MPQSRASARRSLISVLCRDEVGHGLWLFICMPVIMPVVVVVSVSVVLRSNVLHLQHIAALWAALNRAVLGNL